MINLPRVVILSVSVCVLGLPPRVAHVGNRSHGSRGEFEQPAGI